jgi:RNA polymerase sigma-70 factor (ECF subfamily)
VHVDAAYREHWARLLALLARELRDIDLAEDALQEAFSAASRAWGDSPPRNPAAWLLTAARRRAIDDLRRQAALARRLPLLVVDQTPDDAYDIEPDMFPDERLRLIFTCAHPALDLSARVALTLRLVAGLTTAQIARLFLVSEPTMAARITRAKKKIVAAGIPYRVPGPNDLAERLQGVHTVVYAIFTEGYAATDGDRLVRVEVCGEAIHLGRMLVALMPSDPESSALLALMLLHNARRSARVDGGQLVRLADQDRSRWRMDEIAEGLGLTSRVLRSGAGPYAIQAAIAAEHAVAATADVTDWPAIVELYRVLEERTASPVVRMNRAVAVAECEGPAAGLAVLEGLDEALARHHLLPAIRADLLRRLGRTDEAVRAYDKALALVGNGAERDFLVRQRLGTLGS